MRLRETLGLEGEPADHSPFGITDLEMPIEIRPHAAELDVADHIAGCHRGFVPKRSWSLAIQRDHPFLFDPIVQNPEPVRRRCGLGIMHRHHQHLGGSTILSQSPVEAVNGR